MVLSIVAAVPVSSKPPAVDVSMRTSTGGRCGSGASTPSSTRASPTPLLGARGSVDSSPKLVKRIRSSSIRADEISPYFSSFAAALSIRSRVFMSLHLPSRQDVAAEPVVAVLLDAGLSFSSS